MPAPGLDAMMLPGAGPSPSAAMAPPGPGEELPGVPSAQADTEPPHSQVNAKSTLRSRHIGSGRAQSFARWRNDSDVLRSDDSKFGELLTSVGEQPTNIARPSSSKVDKNSP